MNRRVRVGAAVAAVVFALAARAGVTTTVALKGHDPDARKYALPSIEVRVDGPDAERAQVVATALARDLASLAHTRVPGRGEIATYAIAIDLLPAEDAAQRFGARLVASDGAVVWSVEGVTRSDAGPVDGDGLRSLARNLYSALVRDGWLQAKYDPNDPPPPPPVLERRGP